MEVFLKLLSFLIAICIISKGLGAACSRSDIIVRQMPTGEIIEGKPEYEVHVSNKCSCIQSEVITRCYGLSSVESVDPQAIRPMDNERCIVHEGLPMGEGTSVTFKYAWMTPQDFPVISSQIHCQ